MNKTEAASRLARRSIIRDQFNSKSKREQLKILEQLSAPYIEQKVISSNAKTLDEIFAFQDKSLETKNNIYKFKNNSNLPPKKKKR